MRQCIQSCPWYVQGRPYIIDGWLEFQTWRWTTLLELPYATRTWDLALVQAQDRIICNQTKPADKPSGISTLGEAWKLLTVQTWGFADLYQKFGTATFPNIRYPLWRRGSTRYTSVFQNSNDNWWFFRSPNSSYQSCRIQNLSNILQRGPYWT